MGCGTTMTVSSSVPLWKAESGSVGIPGVGRQS